MIIKKNGYLLVYLGSLVIVLCLVVSGAKAQVKDDIEVTVEPPATVPVDDKVLLSNLAKNPQILEIIATSSISGSEAVDIYYEYQNKEEIVTALYTILFKLEQIEKNTR